MKFRVIVALTAAALTLTACGSKDETGDTKASERDSAKLVERSPLTGLVLPSGLPNNPVFVVKVENTEGGVPQYGLNKADLVFEELVEGGLTRLAALYYSNLPTKIGHIRSTRATDIGIASPVAGQIVASGGSNGTYRRIKKAGITIFSEDHGAPGFSSDLAKVRPYNRLVNLRRLAKKAKTTELPGNYLPFKIPDSKATPSAAPTADASAETPAPPKTVKSLNVGFSASTHTRWKMKSGKWVRANTHAAPGQDFEADTLMVLFARVGDAGYLDPAGNPVPETIFEGSGRAMILHGNTEVEATWHKQGLDKQITLTDSTGAEIELDPGHIWIELIPKSGGTASLG
ncbi:MAG: DUF3048 domain-containing protein [Aeromicrobium sp.]